MKHRFRRPRGQAWLIEHFTDDGGIRSPSASRRSTIVLDGVLKTPMNNDKRFALRNVRRTIKK